MARVAGGDAVYKAAEHWVDGALRRDDSLFTPGEPIWSLANLNDFHERFVGQPDDSKDTFLAKFERQLNGAPPQTYQLAAEILYLNYLIVYPRTIGGDRKRENINRVLSWSETPIAIPDHLVDAQDSGFVNPGPAFGVSLPAHIQFIAEFLRHWKSLPTGNHELILDNPWDFKKELDSTDVPRSVAQSMALLHLAYPSVFEPILSMNHKNRVRDAFSGLMKSTTDDVDRDLLNLRSKLNRTYGINFHYYSPDLRTVWDPRLSEWERFIGWARRFAEHSSFDRWERYYKEDISSNIDKAKSALMSGKDDWTQALDDAFKPPNNLTRWSEHKPFLDWCMNNPETAAKALNSLWLETSSLPAAIREFLSRVPTDSPSGKNTRAKIAAFLAMAIDPYEYPPFRVRTYQAGYKLTGYPSPASDADEADVYEHALGFLDKVLAEASNYGLKLRDRLDAQSVLWSLTAERFDDVLPESEHDAFKRYRAQTPKRIRPNGNGEVVPPIESANDVAKRLLWDPAHLRNIQRLLEDKRQIVFYGPPGTGKTYVALELARHFASDGGSVDLVQFHPSYAYEDFVEGFRPAAQNGQPGFQLREGPLKRIAERARDNPGATHVLVIDEINRGNVARVFGELYFLLEYRGPDHEISLQYSDRKFSLPDNLWFIATMNTADRSIALVDAALRRRFHFFPFFPDKPPVDGLLAEWLGREKPTMKWVADLLKSANDKLSDRHLAIGPSHFIRKDLDEEWVERIWDYSILPYIEEQLFGQEERLAEFDYAKLRAEVQSADVVANGDGDAASPAS